MINIYHVDNDHRFMHRDQHHSEREHLMSRMETIHRELRSAQMKLTHEQQLRDKANDVYKQLLEEKRHLARK